MTDANHPLALSAALTTRTNALALGLEHGAADLLELVTPTTAELLQSRQVLGIHLQGCCIAQCHPGAAIELIGHGIELLLGVAAQIRTLGKVLAPQPSRVCCAASRFKSSATTIAPSAANWRAMARPMPWPAPVTSATLSLSFMLAPMY